jgi:hypothetical protein
MLHRLSTAVPAIVLALTMSLIGAPGANASTPDSVSSLGLQEKWGVNYDGWHITITNNIVGKTLYYESWTSIVDDDGVYVSPVKIPSGLTDSSTRGTESWLAEHGPANMFINYMSYDPNRYPPTSDLAAGWSRYIEVKAKSSGETTVKCGVYKTHPVINSYYPGEGCDVLKAIPTEPISVVFGDLEDGPCKG